MILKVLYIWKGRLKDFSTEAKTYWITSHLDVTMRKKKKKRYLKTFFHKWNWRWIFERPRGGASVGDPKLCTTLLCFLLFFVIWYQYLSNKPDYFLCWIQNEGEKNLITKLTHRNRNSIKDLKHWNRSKGKDCPHHLKRFHHNSYISFSYFPYKSVPPKDSKCHYRNTGGKSLHWY